MQLSLSRFLQWKINILLCQKLGWNFAFFYIMVLGNLYFLFKQNEKKKIKEAVTMVFAGQKKESEKRTIVRGVFKGILWHYYEKIFNVYSSLDRLKSFFNQHIEPEGIPAIEQGIARGRGVLLVTGHFGGIEFIPAYLADQNYPVTVLAKFSSKYLRDRSIQKAGKFATKIIDANDCSNIIKAIINDLKENRIVITQCDEIEEWRPSFNEEVSFLGKRIHPDKTINTIIKRGNATVVFAVMKRINKQGYKFIAHSYEELLNSYEHSRNISIGEVVLKNLEQYIYHHPEEWYQWKNVPKIKRAEDLTVPVSELSSPSWMKPAFGEIS